jgi:hypothetical protein
MKKCFLIQILVATSAMLWGADASGETEAKEQVGIRLGIDRTELSPGECFNVCVSCKVLDKKPLMLPTGYYDSALVLLYLKAPDGNLFVYYPYRKPKKDLRPLTPKDFRQTFLPHAGFVILTTSVSLVEPSPDWLDVATEKPANPNFRKVGQYEVWVEYHVPRIDGAHADAWHGRVRSDTVSLTVRQIPISKRKMKLTSQQLADIENLMRGKGRSHADRLMKALQNTENEGLASHICDLLKKHQPHEDGARYPTWWNNLYHALSARAYHSGALAIQGPYLKDFAEVTMTALEHRMQQRPPRAAVDFLIAYCQTEDEESKSLQERLAELARPYAVIPQTKGDHKNHRLVHLRLWTSWRILFGLGILYDEMPLSEATNILGQPQQRETHVTWLYASEMHVNPMLNATVSQGAKGETVRFMNRKYLK